MAGAGRKVNHGVEVQNANSDVVPKLPKNSIYTLPSSLLQTPNTQLETNHHAICIAVENTLHFQIGDVWDTMPI
jgi:hypothetical protein